MAKDRQVAGDLIDLPSDLLILVDRIRVACTSSSDGGSKVTRGEAREIAGLALRLALRILDILI